MDVEELLNPEITQHGLFVMGHVTETDHGLVLIGADHGFWDNFKNAREYSDRHPDPIDRWSKRIINRIAAGFEGTAIFPSNGSPYAPFIA